MSSRPINATAASLLGFLHAGPMTGWELDRAVEATIANFWNVTRSQVYRELRTLAELGYVEAGDPGPRERRPYTLTEAGGRVFDAWIARHPDPPIIRMPVLLTIFFAEHLPPGRLEEIVAADREGHLAALAHLRAKAEEVEAEAPFTAAVARFGIGYHEMALRWLDTLPPGPAGPIR